MSQSRGYEIFKIKNEETDQCKLGGVQKYLEEEYHYPHRNDHVINTANVKPQKN